MHPDLLALLETVKDNPGDESPRLVLADWLEENGRDEPERARGELIRVQCTLTRMGSDDPARPPARAREQQLLQDHLAAWFEGLPRRHPDAPPAALKDSPYHKQGCMIERGLLRPWFITGQRWLDEVPPDSPVWAWVDGLWLVDLRLPEIHEVAASPILGQVNFLALGPDSWSGWTGDQAPGPEGARVLASSPYLTRLTHLDLSDCVIGPKGAMALAESPQLRQLTHLDLSGFDCTPANYIRDEGVRVLAGSAHLSCLTHLNLIENGITAEGARALAESRYLSGLTYLELSGNPVGPEGARALASSPFLTRLTHLGLELSTNRYMSAGYGVSADAVELDSASKLLRRRFGKVWSGARSAT